MKIDKSDFNKWRKLCAGLTACCVMTVSASAQEWTSLFDGESVCSMRGYKRDSFPDKGWKIEDGILKTITGGDVVDLVTIKDYSSFELELEWAVQPGGNSGVMYRVTEEFDAPWHTGPEMQILDDSRHPDGKNPKTSAGSLYALIARDGVETRPVGEFNHARIVVRGNHVEHWLNHRKAVEYQWGSDEVSKLIESSKFRSFPDFMRNESGKIAIQHHGEEAWFRNIKIRELSAKNNQLTASEKASGWKLLFDGESTEAWRGMRKEGFPEKGWIIEDESIHHVNRGGGGDIITKDTYGSFDFRFEWKVAPAANSGVKYRIVESRGAVGSEYQVLDDDLHPDAKAGRDGNRKSAGLYDIYPPSKNKTLRPVGSYNSSRILVQDKQVQHWLNGALVLEYELESPEFKEAIQLSKFKNSGGFDKAVKGHILLQDHSDAVWYRNLKIRSLD